MTPSLLRLRLAMVLALAGLLGASCHAAGTARPGPEALAFFETRVRPVLAEQCFKCHGEKKQRGGLRLDSRAGLLTGGDQGPAIVPGQPERSLLVKAIRYTDEHLQMPPRKRLAREQVAALTTWVKMGAPWPGAEATVVAPKRGGFHISDKDRAHWAFQPLKRPVVPAVKDQSWVRNPLDALILAKLEAKGLAPNLPAAKRELLRRAYYDLTGLPPTPAEVEAFVADHAPDAFERRVDQLLDSPHYGEKWGRHWLDLVRFAETNSYERDGRKPHAWRYRDYVIRSFNADKPYDRFVREQLAGDELPDGGDDGLIATGYYRLGIWDDEPTDHLQARYDGLDDIVATTGQVFLGLTFDCARCHDHKLDPIPQKDYYRLLAFFHNVNHYRNGGPTDEAPLAGDRAAYNQQVRARRQRRQDLETAVAAFEAEFRKLHEQIHGRPVADGALPGLIRAEGARLLGKERFARYAEQRRELREVRRQRVPGALALCVSEPGSHAPETFVLIRGNPHVRGDKVQPEFPVIFGEPAPVLPRPAPGARSSGRRLVLANWIASPENRLTARVMANRLWQYHFGRGIVRSPNNFGLQGDKPTHPELLDYLATELIRSGWRLKPLHRLIMTSRAYQMSSRGNAAGLAADPGNDLFWRFDMRRLSAEEVRDSILAVTGSLNPKMYGPGVFTEIPREVMAGQSMPGSGWGHSPPEEEARRSVYVHVKRSLLTPILESFDMAETDRTSPTRFVTTQPTQALAMLNSAFLHKQAAVFAARLRREAGTDPTRQVRHALELATSRPATEAEMKRGVGLIETLRTKDGASPDTALTYFCLLVLNLNEFMYLD